MRVCTYEKCGKETRTLTKGYCPTCYAVYRRTGSPVRQKPNRSYGLTKCANVDCGSETGPFIKGLCRTCYQRQYKHGHVEPTRVRHLCEARGCDDPVHSGGLCQRHYMRLRRHGTPDAGRPVDWGQKSSHPLYEAYKSLMRAARRSGVDPRWEDFWNFIEDVGERPDNARLYRVRADEPYAKGNVEWRTGILSGKRRESHAEYQRAYRMKRGDQNRDRYLKNTYGITLAEFDAMLAAQGGGCAICGAKDGHPHPITGEKVALAMDHDKLTGRNRAILCHPHNRGLGLFNHDPALLRAAAAYIEAHEASWKPSRVVGN